MSSRAGRIYDIRRKMSEGRIKSFKHHGRDVAVRISLVNLPIDIINNLLQEMRRRRTEVTVELRKVTIAIIYDRSSDVVVFLFQES